MFFHLVISEPELASRALFFERGNFLFAAAMFPLLLAVVVIIFVFVIFFVFIIYVCFL